MGESTQLKLTSLLGLSWVWLGAHAPLNDAVAASTCPLLHQLRTGYRMRSSLENRKLAPLQKVENAPKLQLSRRVTTIAGFALLFLWTWLFLQDSFIYTTLSELADSPFLHPWSFATGAFVAAFVIIGLVSKNLDFSFKDKRVLAAIAAVMILGAVFIVQACSFSSPYRVAAALSGGVLVGAATPLFYLEFVRIYLKMNLKEIIIIGSCGTIAASLLYYLLFLLPLYVSSYVLLVFPFGMLFCLLITKRGEATALRERPQTKEKLYIPWKLNATALVHGIGFGVGRWALVHFQEGSWLTHSDNLMYVLGYMVAACILVGIAALMRRSFDVLIYKIGFPILGLGTLLLTIGFLQPVGSFVAALGFRFVDILIWSLVVYLTIAKKVPLGWLVGWSTACLYLGFTFGYFIVDVFSVFSGSVPIQTIIAFVALFILFAALIMTSTKNESQAWGSLKPSDDFLLRPFFDRAVESLSKKTLLTGRQKDVFALLAKGKSKKDIATELYLSQETVKVHARNIYKKLGVHSQQELIAATELEELQFSEGDWEST